ncbi:MAG: NAD(P)-dependent oxidoreductase [Caulobacteraceae bacterium]|nr:NAD(P)-dependent oxidoreductase [Caulobacteraceae bacterium]
MGDIDGRRVLVTGASGLMGGPIAMELAKTNEVYAAARFSNEDQRRALEAAGVRTITFDLADHDLSPLPKSVDVVFHLGALVGWNAEQPELREKVYEVNAGAVGRLASRYRGCSAFVHASTGSLYRYQGERPLREEDQYGQHATLETYAATKIGAEFMLRHLSQESSLPTIMLRIFSLYGPRGGAITARIDRVAQGLPVSVYPGVRNVYTPIYEDDYVEKTIASAAFAGVPAQIVNFAGTEPVTIQDYCEMAGELLDKRPVFEESNAAYPIWADTTTMVRMLGRCRVSMRGAFAASSRRGRAPE